MTKPNRLKLRHLMTERDLKAPDVAEVVGRSAQSVRLWCSATGTDISDDLLKALDSELKGRAD